MVGMKPIPGARITLISDVSMAPYSGMLPGHIAGFYSYDEAHIDLRKLCMFAGATFIHAEVTGMDPVAQTIDVEGRSALHFDLASINIGSTPFWGGVPGADEFATPSKPVPSLLSRWNAIRNAPEKIKDLVVVGGGAGGVELSLSMQRQLGEDTNVHLVHSGEQILQTHNERVQERLASILDKRGIDVRTSERVSEVRQDSVLCESGELIPAGAVFWVTQAKAPKWLAEAGFEVDEGGFVKVGTTLQTKGFPRVFAVGDIACIDGDPRPKSGVFAVRMAKPLLANLRRMTKDKPTVGWAPQKEFLSLIGTASGSAVASRRFLAWESPVMWKWKDSIDRKFMREFSDLPQMDGAGSHGPDETSGDDLESLRRRATMRCSGCAAKVGSPILSRVMDRIRESRKNVPDSPQVLVGMDDPDDAAILAVPAGKHLVQTIDYIPEIVADPYVFGRIAANHCMSDIFAMGADAHSALCLVVAPFGSEAVMEESVFQALSGLTFALDSMGVPLVGGHTAEGDRLALGISANGFIDREAALRKGGLEEGDAIILTKPVGTGCLFAAEMRLEARAEWIDRALQSMLRDNLQASQILRSRGATAMTDITGFGLLGHLAEMLKATGSGMGVELCLDDLPVLDGAVEVSRAGILSSLHSHNRSAFQAVENADGFTQHDAFPLLVDPQTSGGLLASIPEGEVDATLRDLIESGYPDAQVIGMARKAADQEMPVRLC